MPGTQVGYQQYAQADGVQVWEGGLSGSADSTVIPCLVVREDGGCSAYWIGRVPLAFANVDMQDPLLALTCHATLRESKIAAVDKKTVDAGNMQRGDDLVEGVVTANDLMGMRDVLAGLGGSRLNHPAMRRMQKANTSILQRPYHAAVCKGPAIKSAKFHRRSPRHHS